MKSMRLIFLSLVILIGCVSSPEIRSDLSIIPAPVSLSAGSGFLEISEGASFEIVDAVVSPDLVKSSFEKFHSFRFSESGEALVKFELDSSIGRSNSSYQISVAETGIRIKGSSETGVFYGLQTLLQSAQKMNGNLYVPYLEIIDQPEFPHRGLLLDCSRHFFSVETVKKYIDLLAYYKMNVLHWHLTEDQGWRIEIDKYPKLTEVSAWRTEKDGSIYGGFYTKEEIRGVVAYAKERFITVIPEIELPGHSQAALAAYPEISCIGEGVEVANDWGVFREIYCAGNEQTFTFLEDVLTEVMELFPSEYIHIGGDEAPKFRWEHCDKCRARIKAEGLQDEHELQSWFIKRIEQFLNENGRKLIGWDEIMEGGLSPNATIQSWRGMDYGKEAATEGHQVIFSPTSHCYLDYDLKAIDLQRVYSFNPIPDDLPDEFRKNVLGVEVNMWSEHVPNEEVLDSKVFPRMLALAEVAWTWDPDRNFEEFFSRVQNHYPMLKKLGVNYGLEGHPATFTVEAGDLPKLKFVPGVPDLELSYSISDGPFVKYEGPIPVNFTGTLKVQAMRDEVPYGELVTQEVMNHVGIGIIPERESVYNPSYTGGGELALADGLLGSIDFRDGRWQGFFGQHFVTTIDLGSTTRISEVSANFYQYNNAWIFLPEALEISYSDDGQNWKILGANKPDLTPVERGKFIKKMGVKLNEAVKARYLKVFGRSMIRVPEWHEAAGSPAWLFVDEIIIQ
ncbi:MAG: family 20 glycosylhydrolase [Cyclobacteriaceae bacterium]